MKWQHVRKHKTITCVKFFLGVYDPTLHGSNFLLYKLATWVKVYNEIWNKCVTVEHAVTARWTRLKSVVWWNLSNLSSVETCKN
jgi:hypothetical protein